MVKKPSAVPLAFDMWTAKLQEEDLPEDEPFPGSYLPLTVLGERDPGGLVTIYPRHDGEGLNFAFIDEHAQFHAFQKHDGQAGTFVGNDFRWY